MLCRCIYEIGEDKFIRIVCDENMSGITNTITTKQNWVQSNIVCQKLNKEGYRARFLCVSSHISTICDTRYLWIVS